MVDPVMTQSFQAMSRCQYSHSKSELKRTQGPIGTVSPEARL